MDYVEDIAVLEALYGTPPEAAIRKVARSLTPTYRRWIMASRLCVVSTVLTGLMAVRAAMMARWCLNWTHRRWPCRTGVVTTGWIHCVTS